MAVANARSKWLKSPVSAKRTPSYVLRSLTELELSAAMGFIRHRISRSAGGLGNRNNASFANNIARSLKRKHKRLHMAFRGRFFTDKAPLSPAPNLIADHLFRERSSIWRTKRRKPVHLSIKELSFIDNPQQAFDTLQTLIRAECLNRDAKLDFMMDRCRDIAPFLVMGLMWRQMHEIFIGGKIAPPLAKVMRALGLDRFLQMKLRSAHDESEIWSFPLREKQEHSVQVMSDVGGATRDKTASDLVESLNDWLEVATDTDFELSDSGRSNFQKIVCEILENAERHSVGADVVGGWACAGFMARRASTSVMRSHDYVCHLAFVNTGQTISEGLRGSEDDRSKRAIDSYLSKHEIWLRRNPAFRDVLLTLMALQPGVTRKQIKDTTAGGIGFRRIFDALHSLMDGAEGESPEVTIISGNACIQVRQPYGRIMATKEGFKGLYFNPENTIYELPDGKFVSRLTHGFPGTIIAARFLVDPAKP